jgi:type VI secretion system protein ImpE
MTLEAPEDLRDLVWMPAHLRFENGGESLALIPTRYRARTPGGRRHRARTQDLGESIGRTRTAVWASASSQPTPARPRSRDS